METTPRLKGWLPKLNPVLAPRLNALLQPGSLSDCLILDHADEHALRVHLRERGLKTVMEDGLAKVREGVTSLSEIQQMGAHVGFSTSKPVRRSRRSGRSPTHRKAKHARATDTPTP